jgi:hypothetical protein
MPACVPVQERQAVKVMLILMGLALIFSSLCGFDRLRGGYCAEAIAADDPHALARRCNVNTVWLDLDFGRSLFMLMYMNMLLCKEEY